MEQLSAHAGEEAILLSASLDDGTLSHVGSKSGEIFINTHGQVREQFLGFCMRSKLLFISYKFVKRFLVITFFYNFFFCTETYMMCVNVFYVVRNKVSVGSDKK